MRHPITGRNVSGRIVTGHYETRGELEDAIAQSLTETPELPWLALGMRHGVSASTARNIAVKLIEQQRVRPYNGY